MTHCIECGAEVEADDKFCPECGETVVKKGKSATDLQTVRSEAVKKREEKKQEPKKKTEKPEAKDLQALRSSAAKKEKKKTEGEGSGIRKLILGLALVFLIMSLTFFIMVIPKATRMHFITTPVKQVVRSEDTYCKIGGDMGCLSVKIHQNAVAFSFQNPLKRDVIITKVTVGVCEPAELNLLIKPGGMGVVIVRDCTLGGLAQYVEAKVTVYYDVGTEQRKVQGEIGGIIQYNLKTAVATPVAVEKVKIENVVIRTL